MGRCGGGVGVRRGGGGERGGWPRGNPASSFLVLLHPEESVLSPPASRPALGGAARPRT